MCSCVGGAQLSQELQSKLALSSRQARSDQRSFEVASSATFAPIFAALASASATMCLAFAFPHSSQRFARRARALQLEARFCEVAPADQKTAKISFLAGQDVAPPSPRLRSPYPRQCALAASGLSLSLFSHVARSPRGAGNIGSGFVGVDVCSDAPALLARALSPTPSLASSGNVQHVGLAVRMLRFSKTRAADDPALAFVAQRRR